MKITNKRERDYLSGILANMATDAEAFADAECKERESKYPNMSKYPYMVGYMNTRINLLLCEINGIMPIKEDVTELKARYIRSETN